METLINLHLMDGVLYNLQFTKIELIVNICIKIIAVKLLMTYDKV
jgi:hypothetical protein